MPSWLQGDVLDIRTLVLECLYATQTEAAKGMPVAQVCCPRLSRGIDLTVLELEASFLEYPGTAQVARFARI
jgi:hypothetical protein